MIKLLRCFKATLKRNKSLRVTRYVLHEQGFTLAELIIVVAIIGIFSSLTVVNFRGNEKVRTMDNQARSLLDGVKRMQTSSLSGKIIANQIPISYIFEINKCLITNCLYSLKAKNVIGGTDNIDTVLLDQSIVEIDGNNLVIEMTPPRSDIKMYMDGVLIPNNEVIITLKNINDSSVTKRIRINGISGRMDILRN